MLPPGRARLVTTPVPTGSPADAITIGITDVACFAARTAGVLCVTMTSTLRALLASLRPAILDCNGATFDPAELTQPLRKSGEPFASSGMGVRTQEADGPQTSGLLRARRERPRHRRAAEQRDELAAAAHSITSSASCCNCRGTLRPRAFAVLRLITSSNLVGCSTGRSAGLSPLRIRPV